MCNICHSFIQHAVRRHSALAASCCHRHLRAAKLLHTASRLQQQQQQQQQQPLCPTPPLPRRLHRSWLPPGGVASADIRRQFLEFFANSHSHTIAPSSSIVASDTEGAYFVNAGVNQFKERLADGRDASPLRVASCQRCARVGGKRNDVDSVGRDGTHHTLFEMLGNWSFGGAYDKEAACRMAWQLLTGAWQLPPQQLYVTYFGGDRRLRLPADTDTRDIWLSLGVSDQKLLPFGVADNFWEMADTGPCGPATEIHFDHVGGRCARCFVNSGLPDVVELWNIVFMQHLRDADGSLSRLPPASAAIDTGMGLERISAVLQGVTSAYDTDLFEPLISELVRISGDTQQPYTGSYDNRRDAALRLVADHARLLTVAVADGLLPGNRGVGHKLRQAAHRLSLHCHFTLGVSASQAIGSLSPLICQQLSAANPQLLAEAQVTETVGRLAAEEERRLLSRLPTRQLLLDARLMAEAAEAGSAGQEAAVQLLAESGCGFDTFAFFAEWHGVRLDGAARTRLRLRLRAAAAAAAEDEKDEKDEKDEDVGVRRRREAERRQHRLLLAAGLLRSAGVTPTDTRARYGDHATGAHGIAPLATRIVALVSMATDDTSPPELVQEVDLAAAQSRRQQLHAVLESSSFYCAAGGQESDAAELALPASSEQSQPPPGVSITDGAEVGGYVLHTVAEQQQQQHDVTLRVGQSVSLAVDARRRQQLSVHHTATHVIAGHLRRLLGNAGFLQRSSSVRRRELTLGFACRQLEQRTLLQQLQAACRSTVDAALPVCVRFDDANVAAAATRRRIVAIGDDMQEACCGSHVANTQQLGDIVLVSMSASGQGVMEIRAVAGEAAAEAKETAQRLMEEAEKLRMRVKQQAAVGATEEEELANERQLADLRRRVANSAVAWSDRERTRDLVEVSAGQIRAARHARAAASVARQLAEAVGNRSVRLRVDELCTIGLKRAILRKLAKDKDSTFGSASCALLLFRNSALAVAPAKNVAELQQLIDSRPDRQSRIVCKVHEQHELAAAELPLAAAADLRLP